MLYLLLRRSTAPARVLEVRVPHSLRALEQGSFLHLRQFRAGRIPLGWEVEYPEQAQASCRLRRRFKGRAAGEVEPGRWPVRIPRSCLRHLRFSMEAAEVEVDRMNARMPVRSPAEVQKSFLLL